MARVRTRAAVRKRQQSEAHAVAQGVYQVARDVERHPHPLPLLARAPLQYVCEQMAWAVCKAKGIPFERHTDVAAYLLAGLQDFAVSLFGDFKMEHFEAWTAAAAAGEVASE